MRSSVVEKQNCAINIPYELKCGGDGREGREGREEEKRSSHKVFLSLFVNLLLIPLQKYLVNEFVVPSANSYLSNYDILGFSPPAIPEMTIPSSMVILTLRSMTFSKEWFS